MSWWVVTYVAQGTGAAQLGTVIVQASSASAARSAAAAKLPPNDQVGAARGPYPSQSAAANAGVSTSGGIGKGVNPIPGTGAAGSSPPSGSGQVPATPSNLGSSTGCLVGGYSVNLGITSVPVPCLLSKTQARAIIGGLIIGASGIVGLVGVLILAAEGFRASGGAQGLQKAGGYIAFVPGLQAAGLAVRSAGAAAQRGAPAVKAAPKAVPKPAPKKPAAKPAPQKPQPAQPGKKAGP